MAEQPHSASDPEKNNGAGTSWEEQKQAEQTAFSEPGNTIAADYIQMQRQRNVEFWSQLIAQEHLRDRTIPERENQPDQAIEPGER